jgi:hypothetical protein
MNHALVGVSLDIFSLGETEWAFSFWFVPVQKAVD